MQNLVNYQNYSDYLREFVHEQKRGYSGKLAKAADLHPTVLSQILSGMRDLNLDQAYKVSTFIAHNDLERELFLLLVQKRRAGHFELENYFNEKIKETKEKFKDLKEILPDEIELTKEDQSVLYSNWFYVGIRILSAIDDFQTIEAIADKFHLERNKVSDIVNFLSSKGLVIKDGEEIRIGPNRTHLDKNSPFIYNHHSNWRLKAIEQYSKYTDEDLSFTGPMAINKKDADKIRAVLVNTIKKVGDEVGKSKNVDGMFCFSMDWFQIK